MDVSIIIVNYNTKKYLSDCLTSIYKETKDISFEIIVSDNGSTDGSLEMIKQQFPNVILLENNRNIGFGAANNKGLKIAKGKYILYLNSDTVLLNNAIKYFFDYYENNKEPLGALGCNLVNDNLNTVLSYNNFPTKQRIKKNLKADLYQLTKRSIFFYINKTNGKTHNLNIDEKYGNVDSISGADLFMINNEDAYFDESFFLYFEDTDLNKRLQQKKLQRKLIKGPIIKHLEHKSNTFSSPINYYSSFSKLNYNLSAIKYLKKYGCDKFNLFFCKLLVSLQWINPFIISKAKPFFKQLWLT